MPHMKPLDEKFPIELQLGIEAYPSSIVARPHLFQKIGVAGICTA